MRRLLTILTLLISLSLFGEPPSGKDWAVVFEDNFDYPNAQLDKDWLFQNGSNIGHVLCSRWRENASTADGILKLVAKKEQRGGQDWTAASMWTKKLFKYGYFECRFKYAAATGTNNAFWLMPRSKQDLPQDQPLFEIDINEGHYPDEINLNLHNHSDRYKDEKSGKTLHKAWGKTICLTPYGGTAERTISLDVPIVTQKIRFSTEHPEYFHLRKMRVFSKNADGFYPDIKLKNIPKNFSHLEEYAHSAKIIAHSPTSQLHSHATPENALDPSNYTSWITAGGGAFLELDFGAPKNVGAVQFLTGWWNDDKYVKFIHDFKLEYFDGENWVAFAELKREEAKLVDLSRDFHTYALEWNEDYLIYYFDGKEIHRQKNSFCHWESPVLLSLAVANFSGMVTDKIDGTSMDVDYVKIWQEAGKESVKHYPQKK